MRADARGRGAPLSGLVVADFTRVLAGPLATMTLGDLGARVIKIERPGLGDDTRAWGPPFSAHGSTYYESVNRGKESIALDLSEPRDRQTAIDIAARADVLIENFQPGTMERLGLGYEALRERNPRLIYCSITGFGSAGGSDLLGYDFIVQAVGGLMSITGEPGGPPLKVGVALVDVLTGKDAVTGVLAALVARNRTGLGDHLEVTLLTSLLGAMVNQGQASLETGRAGQLLGNRHPSIAPYETLRARDAVIAVACGNDAQFARLAAVLEAPELAQRAEFRTNTDRVAHRGILVADLERLLAAADADHWVERLTAARVPAGRIRTIPEAIELAERLGLDPTVEVGHGWTRQVRHPIRWKRSEPAQPTPPPHPDADADAVRRWLDDMAPGSSGVATTASPTPPQANPTKELPVKPNTSTPRPLDLVDVASQLTDDERAVQATVRQVCERSVDPYIADWFERGELPVVRELAKEFGALGLLGMQLEGYGCSGMSAVDYGLACLELEASDSAIRSFVSVQGSLAMHALWEWGSEEQKQQWLPQMASGEAIGCFGLTEPDHGSDPASMRTEARRDGADWVLNGSKMWITNGSIADVAVVWARTGEGERHRIRGFVVPTATAGFSAPEIKHKMSLRASVTSELVLDNVRLPAEAVLPGAVGLKGPLSCLNEARYGILWGAMGAARSAFAAALRYSTERRQFGRPIASFQLTQAKLAQMNGDLSTGLLLALHLGRLKDDQGLRPEQVSIGKLNNVSKAIEICRTARTILGANGISLEFPVMRHANNLESVLTYEGTPEMHSLIVGSSLTGESAFR